MSLIEQLRTDVNTALKAGDRERAGALRMVLSELQKAAKEGGDDDTAVLRRERKRRLDAAEQFRQGGRDELAEKEQAEAGLIESYLPSELDDTELQSLVTQAIAETGVSDPKDMGKVMKVVMSRAGGRVDGKRASAQVREALGAS